MPQGYVNNCTKMTKLVLTEKLKGTNFNNIPSWHKRGVEIYIDFS
jgi:tRNA(His) 5'-end guanylyltransferase